MDSIKIENIFVGKNHPVFIIAEAGVNHNGKLDLALKLVDAAKNAGADAVKFQTFKAEQVVIESTPMAEYQKKNLGVSESQLSMIKKLELDDESHKTVSAYCKKLGIIFMSTPHGGFESVDFLEKLGVPAFKIGSADLTNHPLLERVARLKKPVIISTGMATMTEIKEAVRSVRKQRNNKIIVLHCTTNYPCLESEVNLRAMQTIERELNVLVGYSDHTLGIQVPIMAASLGACLIEKHFTLDKTMHGSDHVASLEPKELTEMVTKTKAVETILGSATKKPTRSELLYIPIVRKSIVAACNIESGEKLSKENISIKRPGTGIAPKYFSQFLGKKTKRNIKKDSLLRKTDIGI